MMLTTKALTATAALLLSTSLALAQVPAPMEPNTVPVEYESLEGDALLGHLSVPMEGEGPFPGTFISCHVVECTVSFHAAPHPFSSFPKQP